MSSPTSASHISAQAPDEFLLFNLYKPGLADEFYTPKSNTKAIPPQLQPKFQRYHAKFIDYVQKNVSNRSKELYRSQIKGNYNIMAKITQNNDFNEFNAWICFTNRLNEAYFVEKQANPSLTVANFNPSTNKHCVETIELLCSYFTALFSTQNLDNSSEHYGLLGKFGSSTLQEHQWVCWKYLSLLLNFLPLLPSQFLGEIRRNIYASLSAQWNCCEKHCSATGEQSTTAQWLQKITGITLHCSFLLYSERELYNRKAWKPEFSYGNEHEKGWNNAKILELADEMSGRFSQRLKLFGCREFNSTYYIYALDMIVRVLFWAPSQPIYDRFYEMLQLYWWDIAANYFLGSNSLSGAIGRGYNLLLGARERHDTYLINIFMRTFNETEAIPSLPPSQDSAFTLEDNYELHFSLFQYYFLLCTQQSYDPWLDLANFLLNQPCRVVEQRISSAKGQERYNFIHSDHYSMGHAAEDHYETNNNSLLAVKLAGPKADHCAQLTSSYNSGVFSLNLIRILVDRVNNNEIYGKQCHDLQLSGRLLTVQHRNFMLVSSLVAPSSNNFWENYPDQFSDALNTNILLPLAAQEIRANNQLLPMKISPETSQNGAVAVAIPLNSVISVQHGSSVCLLRVLHAEFSQNSSISHAKSLETYSNWDELYSGKQGASLIYQLDRNSVAYNSSRLTIHHKHSGENSLQPFHTSYLLACLSNINNNSDLQRAIDKFAAIPVENKLECVEFDGKTEGGSSEWHISAQISPELAISVHRKELFSKEKHWNDKNYGDSSWKAPYIMREQRRQVNGKEILQWKEGETAYRSEAVQGEISLA
jgi:hypothetical protein